MVNITQISPTLITPNINISSQDENLISSFDIDTTLLSSSYIEYNVYDLNNNLLYNTYNYNSYSIINDGQSSQTGNISQIIINPNVDLENLGFTQGEYNSYYSILNKRVGSNLETLYIEEISSDRIELRLDSVNLDDIKFQEQSLQFINDRDNSTYFLDFYINFGENNLIIANNIQLSNEDPTNATLLIKLYEPLPETYGLKSELWVVTSVEEPLAYNVEFIEEPIIIQDSTPLKGPNFNLEVKDQINNSSVELSYSDIINTSLPSSQNQLNSLLEEKEIDINIDFSDFSNFTHFSSAAVRLENFSYKVSLIEQYSSSINIIDSNITGSTSSSLAVMESKVILEDKISSIITNFDNYEYYLYYESSSYAWPKTNTTQPYLLASTGSLEVLNWFGSTNENSPLYGGMILSASSYDSSNKDNLLFSIPEYLREDPENYPYELFINMVAQHYDNIWVYIKDVTQKFNSDNRLNYGISKDLVADAIRDFGVKLYQNNFSNEDIFTSFLGLTPEGSLFPFPNITGSLPTPNGYEYIDTLISASNDNIPLDDVNKSLYKRIYHNIPLLSKTRGTKAGLQNLITTFGITSSIFEPKEFGGDFKYDRLKGHNHLAGKIHLINNQITGSVLSPFISLQQPVTSSALVQSTDLHFIDLSFSPQHAQNDLISASIARTHTTFSVDDYIGDPRYMYTDSYTELLVKELNP